MVENGYAWFGSVDHAIGLIGNINSPQVSLSLLGTGLSLRMRERQYVIWRIDWAPAKGDPEGLSAEVRNPREKRKGISRPILTGSSKQSRVDLTATS